ncbi:MAG: hypothetical protein KAQ83_04165, partial [Nanoarchaeota archaeon]|nr:hypothetical protein [Nanoarchaeota archaeon]
MKVITKKDNILTHKTNVLVIPMFEKSKFDFKAIDKKLNNEISRIIKAKEFKGEFKEFKNINTHSKLNAKNILLLGLGKEKELKTESIRKAYAVLGKVIKSSSNNSFSLILPETKFKNIAQIITEGIILGTYNFNKYKTVDKEKIKQLEYVVILNGSAKDIKKGKILTENVNKVRDLVNEPAEKVTPSYLANYSKKIASANKKTSVKVFGKKEIGNLKIFV